MPFKKGQSGNPGGKPKELKGIQELARGYSPEAIEALVNIVRSGKSESAVAMASNSILDRGYGKPPQFSTGDNAAFRKAIEMSDDDIDRELAEVRAALGREGSAPLDKTQLN